MYQKPRFFVILTAPYKIFMQTEIALPAFSKDSKRSNNLKTITPFNIVIFLIQEFLRNYFLNKRHQRIYDQSSSHKISFILSQFFLETIAVLSIYFAKKRNFECTRINKGIFISQEFSLWNNR